MQMTLISRVFEAVKYDAAREEHHLQEAKQRELQRIEEALLLVARRGKYSHLVTSMQK